MNTLYININGDDIKSTENITVVGKPEDAIINKFYFELVKGIVKGVTAPGIGEVKKKSLVTDFEAINAKAFAEITEQWDLVKQALLGENPDVTFTVTLPQEYVEWLYNHKNPVYNKVAESLANRGNAVEINIGNIYRNGLIFLVNNIDTKKEYGQFVVSDTLVDDKSAIAVAIRKKIGEDVPFVAFAEFEVEGSSEEYELGTEVDGEFEYGSEWSSLQQFEKGDIVVNGVILGTDSLLEFMETKCVGCNKSGDIAFYTISEEIYAIVPQLEYEELGNLFSSFSDEVTVNRTFPIHLLKKIAWLRIAYSQFPLFNDLGISSNKDIQENVEIIEGLGYLRIKNIIKVHKDDENVASFVSKTLNSNGNHTFLVLDDDYMYVYDDLLTQWIPYDDGDLQGETPTCPKCGSDDVTDDGSGFLQYTCNDCGRAWGNRDDIECPECGSDDVTDDGSDCLQYVCNECGHMWGDDDDDSDGDSSIEKEWSNKNDFRRGDIIVDGLTMGVTDLLEVLENGKFNTTNVNTYFDMMYITEGITSVIAKPGGDKIVDFVNSLFSYPRSFNLEFLVKTLETINWLRIDHNSTFFDKVGASLSNSFYTNISLLQQNGYTRIKNVFKADENKSKVASFVCKSKNSHGTQTFLVLYDDCIHIFDDVLNNWLPY